MVGRTKKLRPPHAPEDGDYSRDTTSVRACLTAGASTGNTPQRIPWRFNGRVPAQPTGKWLFGVQLSECIRKSYPRASHQPAAFCWESAFSTCFRSLPLRFIAVRILADKIAKVNVSHFIFQIIFWETPGGSDEMQEIENRGKSICVNWNLKIAAGHSGNRRILRFRCN
jgi:hypothetical protein